MELLALIIVYMFPFLIAVFRGHLGKWSIMVVNLALGWTFIGWFICLIWSLNSNTKSNYLLKGFV